MDRLRNAMHRVELFNPTILCFIRLVTAFGSWNPRYSANYRMSVICFFGFVTLYTPSYLSSNFFAQIMKWVSSVFSTTSLFTHRAILIAPFSCPSRSFPRLFKRPSRGRTLAGLENIALNITTRFVVSFRNMPELSFHIVTCNGSTNKNGTCEEFSCSYCLD